MPSKKPPHVHGLLTMAKALHKASGNHARADRKCGMQHCKTNKQTKI